MKPPPFLIGATLLFWGWQTDHLMAGAATGLLLESAPWIKARWEFTDQDFRRIWVFCALLLLAVAVYAFTATGGPGDLMNFLQNPNPTTERNAGINSAHAVAVWLRSLPLVFFLFMLAQTFNAREGIPPETISLLMHWRWQRANKLGNPIPHAPNVNVSFGYYAVCLFAACFRTREDNTFIWGFDALLWWALWSLRSRRFSVAVWAGALGAATVIGYFGQLGVGRTFRFIENYNPQWFSRSPGAGTDPMQSKTALGHIGKLKTSGKIVIRLEPKEGSRAPALLREASYRTYESRTWYTEIARDRFDPVNEDPTNHTTWILLPGKTNDIAVNLACYLPGGNGLLPLPPGSGRLENLPAFTLHRNSLGAVLAQGPGLVIYDARYGPGETVDAPATEEDLRVSPKETNALNQVIAELHLEPRNRKQAQHALAGFFADKFRYSVWEGIARGYTNQTPLSRFLLRTHAGHCEYFATATVLLLRQLHIPARYAVGFAVHEASGNKYVVRERDAHAWCLVWNETVHTWQDFDTTPASWVQAEGSRASMMQTVSDMWSWVVFEFSKFRWGQTHLRQYILWALAPIMALLLYQIIFRSRRRQHARTQGASGAATWPGLDSEFYQIERRILERGAARRPSEPLTAWLLRVLDDPALADLQSQLRELLSLHYRYRFDPQGLPPSDREALRRESQGCLARIG